MADADEDRIPSASKLSRPVNPENADNDSASDGDSDTAPDYRFLPSTTTTGKKHELPARGMKDFEPNATVLQSNTLNKSRQAMTDALSVLRVHTSKKGEMVGVYFANEEDWDGSAFDRIPERTGDSNENSKPKRSTALIEGEGRCVVVEKFTNTYVRTMGKSDRRNWVWLLPEEALFLIERGTLDIRYESRVEDDPITAPEESVVETVSKQEAELSGEQDGNTKETGDDQGNASKSSVASSMEEEESIDPPQSTQKVRSQLIIGSIPMSLQGAYAAFIGKSGLNLERYTVYANLKRAGFVVQRAPTFNGPAPADESTSSDLVRQSDAAPSNHTATSTAPIALISRLLSYLFRSPPKPSTMPCHNSIIGPLISPGLFRNYYDVYRQLYLIPQYNHTEGSFSIAHSEPDQTTNTTTGPQAKTPIPDSTDPPLRPTYLLHKPSALQNYKKTSPPPPHYQVVVLPARETVIPTSAQIGDLLAFVPEDPLPNADRKKFETRIKHGKRNVLIAIVDCGLVSYMRFSSGGFEENLWSENEKRGVGRGGKRGGGWGRGRGRGRGQGTRGRGG